MHRDLAALTQECFDIVVIGAGIYGACCARDAASRGFKVALVDRGDFGSATSHNSLKLIHGGIRYIQHLDFVRMRQSINERRYWLTAAPHLVRPLKCIIPTYGHGIRGPEAMWIASRIHELLGYDRNKGVISDRKVRHGRTLSANEVRTYIPCVEPTNLSGGAIWYDGQMLDADRLLLECVFDAEQAGAIVANYVEVTEIQSSRNRVIGVSARDQLSSTDFTVRAKMVINASGPWINTLLRRPHLGLSSRVRFPLTMNMNMVTRPLLDGFAAGVYSRRASNSLVDRSNRLFFVTPWRDKSVIGTTHEPYGGNPDRACVSDSQLCYFIDEFNDAFPSASLSLKDVHYCYWGLTPGAGGLEDGQVRRARRSMLVDHSKVDGIEGLISVVGIKYTTARAVAEKAVDLAAKHLGRSTAKYNLKNKPLPGAIGFSSHNDIVNELTSSYSPESKTRRQLQFLVESYGTRCKEVLTADTDTNPMSDDALFRQQSYYAVRNEMAMTLEDVIVRRTDLAERGLLDEQKLQWCALMMTEELNWTRIRSADELQRTRERLHKSHCAVK